MKQHMSNFVNRTELRTFVNQMVRKPWTDSAKLEQIVKYVNSNIGVELPGTAECEMIRNSESPTGLRCSVCCGPMEYDSAYCRHCGSKVRKNSPKHRFMLLIDNMPPHEGKTFEEALAEWLIENGATLPKEG